MKMRYVFSFCLGVFFMILMFIMTGVPITAFINLPVFLLMLLLPGIMLFASPGPAMIVRAFSVAFSRSSFTEEELIASRSFFLAWGRGVNLSGAFGVLSGIIAILGKADTVAFVGSYAAIALLSPLYAVMFRLLFIEPLRESIERRLV